MKDKLKINNEESTDLITNSLSHYLLAYTSQYLKIFITVSLLIVIMLWHHIPFNSLTLSTFPQNII